MTARLEFAPGAPVEIDDAPPAVLIKGRAPRLVYDRTFADVYAATPSEGALEMYRSLTARLSGIHRALAEALDEPVQVLLPPAETVADAKRAIAVVADPIGRTVGLGEHGEPIAGRHPQAPGPEARPFPMAAAAPAKLGHSLGWIDTNLKLAVEEIGAEVGLPDATVRKVALLLLSTYAHLLKGDDHRLARSISFNHSMFLQERLLELAFGRIALMHEQVRSADGERTNRIMLEALRELGPATIERLCELAVFSGIVWPAPLAAQRRDDRENDTPLAEIDAQLPARGRWAVNEIDRFVAELGERPGTTLAVVLDDNGESVFDLAMVQRILAVRKDLRVDLVLNKYPISENIAVSTYAALVRDSYFHGLQSAAREGRLRVLVEYQMYPSFEPELLTPEAWAALHDAAVVYLKGLGPFETLQVDTCNRYHAFTVWGPTSALLTGYAEGMGVFVNLRPSEVGYWIRGRNVVSLRQLRADAA